MTVIIGKKSSNKQVESARKKVLRRNTGLKQGIAGSFGMLKRGLDGLKYQKSVRNEWN
jgi:hypothetical protein